MQTASGAFAAVMLLPDQTVLQRILLTLPAFQADGVTAIPSSYSDVSTCVVSIQGDVAATTTVPEGTLLINGYSSAAATIVLSGPLKQASGVQTVDTMTVGKLFNSNDPTSPLYRLPKVGMRVVLQEGRWVGGSTPEYITVGTLIVDTCAVSNGAVTLTLIDGRNAIRGQAATPPVITQTPYNAGLTSEYAVDYLFRHSSPGQYLSWPPQRPNCVLAVGFRSSLWPEVGTYASYTQHPVFAPGVFGTGYAESFGATYTLASPIATTQTVFVEFWATPGMEVSINDTAVGNQFTIQWQADTGNLAWWTTTSSGQSGATVTSVGTTGSHYISVKFTWALGSTTCAYVVSVDSTAHSGNLTALDARGSAPFTTVAVFGNPGTVEALQVTTETAPASNSGFAPTLILDPSLNPLTALPDTSSQDIWAALQDIAAAEAAVINIDELNIAHFTNRNSIAAKTSTLTVSSRINLTGLDSLEQLSTVATHVTAPVNQLIINQRLGVWAGNDVYSVPGNGTLVINAMTQNPIVNVDTPDIGFFPIAGPGNRTTWRACATPDGQGAAVTSGVSMALVQSGPTQVQITVTNTNSATVYLIQPLSYSDTTVPAATPFITFAAQPVTNQNVNPVTGGAIAGGAVTADSQWPPGNAKGNTLWGEILLPLPANDWLQDFDAAQALTDFYLSDFYLPKPLLRNASIVSDPRLQLLDRITVVDPDVSQVNADALVVGIHMQLGGGQGLWTRSLDLRMWNAPGLWIVGVSELGVDTFI